MNTEPTSTEQSSAWIEVDDLIRKMEQSPIWIEVKALIRAKELEVSAAAALQDKQDAVTDDEPNEFSEYEPDTLASDDEYDWSKIKSDDGPDVIIGHVPEPEPPAKPDNLADGGFDFNKMNKK